MDLKELIHRISKNDDQAMVELANGLLAGNVDTTYLKPIPLLKRAAQLGNQEALNLLFVLGEDKFSEKKEVQSIEDEIELEERDEHQSYLEDEERSVSHEECDESCMENEERDEHQSYLEDEGDIDEDANLNLLPYEKKFIEARCLKDEGKEKEAYLALEEGVDLCKESDFNENNLMLKDALVSLAAYYLDSDPELSKHYSEMGANIGVAILQYTVGREILLNFVKTKELVEYEKRPEQLDRGIELIKKSIAQNHTLSFVQARVILLEFYLSPNVKGFYRRNFKLIAQYFCDIFGFDGGNEDLMANILLGDFLSRMKKEDLATLSHFAEKVGLPTGQNPRKLAIKAYKRTVRLATQRTDQAERSLAIIAMQNIQRLEKR